MRINLVGAFIRNAPFGTEIAFKKGLLRLGKHLVNCIDTSQPGQVWDHEADATIVFKWMEDYWGDLSRCKGKKIVYQPDDLRFPHIRNMMNKMRAYCDYAFTFDDDGAQMALSEDYMIVPYDKAEKLLLTADDEIYRPLPGVKKDIDVCFVGSLTGGANHQSRMRMCEIVSQIPGIKTHFVTDLYNTEEIVRIYNYSKVVLNHATDVGQSFGTGYGYQCRHFETGFTRACVLSNKVINDTALQNFVEFESEGLLTSHVEGLLEHSTLREGLARDFYDELMASHRPEHRAQQMVDFIESLS
jgi:hypothetical protein